MNDKNLTKLGSTLQKNIVDESTYIEEIEKIIERDYFPDLRKLHAKNQYFVDVERQNAEKIRHVIPIANSENPRPRSPTYSRTIYSPSTFDTPDARNPSPMVTVPSTNHHHEYDETTSNPFPPRTTEGGKRRHLSLDQYMAQNTSEDNACFQQILADNKQRQEQEHPWLLPAIEAEGTKRENEHDMLPGTVQKSVTEPSETWTYRAKNALMYGPDGESRTLKEKLKNRRGHIIEKRNTRFIETPSHIETSQKSITEAVGANALLLYGKIGVDGKEVLSHHLPNVRGSGFVATPSPAPGVSESPIMTWGEIEGSPFRLDGSATPGTSTDATFFKMPKMPRREELAFQLADLASEKQRKKVPSKARTPLPKFGSSTMHRLRTMSPAAQRLVNRKLAARMGIDKTYTPSPSRSASNTPEDKRKRHPTSSPNTHNIRFISSPSQMNLTPSRSIPSEDITDNLLILPNKTRRDKTFGMSNK